MDLTQLKRKLTNLYNNEIRLTQEIDALGAQMHRVRAARTVLRSVYDNIFASLANQRKEVLLKVTAMSEEEAKHPDRVIYQHANLGRILKEFIPGALFVDTPDKFKEDFPELYESRVVVKEGEEDTHPDTIIYFELSIPDVEKVEDTTSKTDSTATKSSNSRSKNRSKNRSKSSRKSDSKAAVASSSSAVDDAATASSSKRKDSYVAKMKTKFDDVD